jgi:hypothetical protein
MGEGTATWGTCATCGDAIPPGTTKCPACGKEFPLQTRATTTQPKFLRRLRIHKTLRMTIVIGVALGLTGVMALALYQGPPVAADPLTGVWAYSIAPGNYSVLSGAVTGGDYVTGNFSVADPPGATVFFEVFNASSYVRFHDGLPASPAQPGHNETSGIIDFSALYTDTYYFVWIDGYAPSSHIAVMLHATTQYMSNVVVE